MVFYSRIYFKSRFYIRFYWSKLRHSYFSLEVAISKWLIV